MLIGYARVSTADQKLDLQNDALTKAGCERIFTDTGAGPVAKRSPPSCRWLNQRSKSPDSGYFTLRTATRKEEA
jgi:hypothetical protein